jgi:hypothetical protein
LLIFVLGILKIDWSFDSMPPSKLVLTSHRILNYWLHQKFLFAMLYLTEFVVLI